MAEPFHFLNPSTRGSAGLYAEIARMQRSQNVGLARGIEAGGEAIFRGAEFKKRRAQEERMQTMQQETAMALLRAKTQVDREAANIAAPALARLARDATGGSLGDEFYQTIERYAGEDLNGARIFTSQIIDQYDKKQEFEQKAAQIQALRGNAGSGKAELDAALKGKYISPERAATLESQLSSAETAAQQRQVLGEIGRETEEGRKKAGSMRERQARLKDARKAIRDLEDSELAQTLSSEIEVLEESTASDAEWSKRFDQVQRQLRGVIADSGMLLGSPPAKRPEGVVGVGGMAGLSAKGSTAEPGSEGFGSAAPTPSAPATQAKTGWEALAPERQAEIVEKLTAAPRDLDRAGRLAFFDAAVGGADVSGMPAEVRARIMAATEEPEREAVSLEDAEAIAKGDAAQLPSGRVVRISEDSKRDNAQRMAALPPLAEREQRRAQAITKAKVLEAKSQIARLERLVSEDVARLERIAAHGTNRPVEKRLAENLAKLTVAQTKLAALRPK